MQYSAKQLDMSTGVAQSLGPALAPATAESPASGNGPSPASSAAGQKTLPCFGCCDLLSLLRVLWAMYWAGLEACKNPHMRLPWLKLTDAKLSLRL